MSRSFHAFWKYKCDRCNRVESITASVGGSTTCDNALPEGWTRLSSSYPQLVNDLCDNCTNIINEALKEKFTNVRSAGAGAE